MIRSLISVAILSTACIFSASNAFAQGGASSVNPFNPTGVYPPVDTAATAFTGVYSGPASGVPVGYTSVPMGTGAAYGRPAVGTSASFRPTYSGTPGAGGVPAGVVDSVLGLGAPSSGRPDVVSAAPTRVNAGMEVDEFSDGRLFVRSLIPGFPAERAGLHVGDQIVKVKGRPVRSFRVLASYMKRARGILDISVICEDGLLHEMHIDLTPRRPAMSTAAPVRPVSSPGTDAAVAIEILKRLEQINVIRTRLGQRPMTLEELLSTASAPPVPVRPIGGGAVPPMVNGDVL